MIEEYIYPHNAVLVGHASSFVVIAIALIMGVGFLSFASDKNSDQFIAGAALLVGGVGGVLTISTSMLATHIAAGRINARHESALLRYAVM